MRCKSLFVFAFQQAGYSIIKILVLTELCDFKMAVIKWQLNYVSCNFGLKSYLRVWNHACHFRPNNCTPLCSIMIINRFYCAKSAIKPTSPVKSSEKLRPTCLLSHTRSWFFSFWNTSIYPTPEIYDTKDKQTRSVPRPYYYFFFRGERERACRPPKNLWNQDNRSFIKIPEDWMLLRAKDFTFTTTESSFCP